MPDPEPQEAGREDRGDVVEPVAVTGVVFSDRFRLVSPNNLSVAVLPSWWRSIM